jgi:ketosteroid isomerase-like protein
MGGQAMTVEEMMASKPEGLPRALRALWHDAHGDWNAAHEVAQVEEFGDCAWVHAYLHRKEGDEGNAGYWYGRAGKSVFRGSLEEEWRFIAESLLALRIG